MKILRPPFVAMALSLLFCGASLLLANRSFHAPERETFALFPMQIANWSGAKEQFSSEIIAALKLEDYLLANFTPRGELDPVNLYIAYYKTQQLGSAAHSPRTCIPGDGWEIESLSRTSVDVAGAQLEVNRAIIGKGTRKQLVYYWFDQRGRVLANEYQVKWFLFVDSLFKNRTDGSLVRVITPISGRDIQSAEKRLNDFLRAGYPRFRPFMPI